MQNNDEKDNNNNDTNNSAAVLDLRGGNKIISAYVLQAVVERLQTQTELELRTDHYQALQSDVLAWGRLSTNQVELLNDASSTNQDCYKITKADEALQQSPKPKLALIVSQDGLEELLTPLGFGVCAVCAGWDVAIFFQGPGVHVLHKDFTDRLSSWMSRPFTCFARRGLQAVGHVSASEKLETLHDLGAVFYACQPSLDHFGVPLPKTIYPDEIVPCEYMTFLEVMKDATIQLFP